MGSVLTQAIFFSLYLVFVGSYLTFFRYFTKTLKIKINQDSNTFKLEELKHILVSTIQAVPNTV